MGYRANRRKNQNFKKKFEVSEDIFHMVEEELAKKNKNNNGKYHDSDYHLTPGKKRETKLIDDYNSILKQAGFRMHVSTDARIGLDRAIAEDYSAILLDIKMPEMDGFQFLEQFRRKKQDVPVMIMTGHPSIGTAASAIRLGASDYMTKPFTPEQIIQSVRGMLALDPPCVSTQ